MITGVGAPNATMETAIATAIIAIGNSNATSTHRTEALEREKPQQQPTQLAAAQDSREDQGNDARAGQRDNIQDHSRRTLQCSSDVEGHAPPNHPRDGEGERDEGQDRVPACH